MVFNACRTIVFSVSTNLDALFLSLKKKLFNPDETTTTQEIICGGGIIEAAISSLIVSKKLASIPRARSRATEAYKLALMGAWGENLQVYSAFSFILKNIK